MYRLSFLGILYLAQEADGMHGDDGGLEGRLWQAGSTKRLLVRALQSYGNQGYSIMARLRRSVFIGAFRIPIDGREY